MLGNASRLQTSAGRPPSGESRTLFPAQSMPMLECDRPHSLSGNHLAVRYNCAMGLQQCRMCDNSISWLRGVRQCIQVVVLLF